MELREKDRGQRTEGGGGYGVDVCQEANMMRVMRMKRMIGKYITIICLEILSPLLLRFVIFNYSSFTVTAIYAGLTVIRSTGIRVSVCRMKYSSLSELDGLINRQIIPVIAAQK